MLKWGWGNGRTGAEQNRTGNTKKETKQVPTCFSANISTTKMTVLASPELPLLKSDSPMPSLFR